MRKGAAQEKHTRGGVLRKTPQSPSRFPQFQVDWRRNLFILHGHKPCHLEPAGVVKMIKLDRILCPTDLSTESDEALSYAATLARAYDASCSCCITASRIESAMRKTGVTVLRDGIETNVPRGGNCSRRYLHAERR
jgi:hypothetical protein